MLDKYAIKVNLIPGFFLFYSSGELYLSLTTEEIDIFF